MPARKTRAVRQPRSMAWLEKLAHHSPVAIYRTDALGRCTYLNERWSQFTGLPASEGMGTGWHKAIHPDDVKWVDARWKEAVRTRRKFRETYRYLRPDGRIVWVRGEAVEERDRSGKLVGYIGLATDVTELQQTREELQSMHDELEMRVRERTQQVREMAMAVEQSEDAIVRTDLAGHITGWNRAAELLYGYLAAEILGQPVWQLVPPGAAESSRKMRDRVLGGHSVQNEEVVRIRKDGTLIDTTLSLFPLRNEKGRIIALCAIARDLSPRKEAERRLRQLSQRLLVTQDEERRRIARELHDSTAQLLATLSINLGRLSADEGGMPPATRRQLLDESRRVAESATLEIRTQSYLLHPPLLEDHGLLAALRFFVEGFTKRSGIRVQLEAPRRVERLDGLLELAIFRIVQEALTNVHRHSASPRAQFALSVGKHWLELSIRDFGRGLSPAADAPGVGIAGMRERVTQLGGEFTVREAGPGTLVEVRLPRLPASSRPLVETAPRASRRAPRSKKRNGTRPV